MRLDVNTDEVVKLTRKLEKAHRSGLPLAVRGTLNRTAFDTKQRTLLKITDKTFTNRTKTFFKANSRVFKAEGWDVNKMVSQVGMVESRLRGANNYAVKDLVEQEQGGSIGGRSLIPISKGARIAGSYQKNVKKKQRVGNIQSVIDAQKMKGNSPKQKAIKAALKAGKGGHFMSTFTNSAGNRIIYEVRGIIRTRSGMKIRNVAVYSYRKGRNVKVKPTKFMERSAKLAAKKLNDNFKIEGERQLKRIFK